MFAERDGCFAKTATAAGGAAARAVDVQKNENDSRQSQRDGAPQRKATRDMCVQRSGALDL